MGVECPVPYPMPLYPSNFLEASGAGSVHSCAVAFALSLRSQF